MDEIIKVLIRNGMQRAVFKTDGEFAGTYYLTESTLRLAIEEMGGFNAFIHAYVREKILREISDEKTGLSVDNCRRLQQLLARMGVSTDESLEGFCLNPDRHVLSLIRYTEAMLDALFSENEKAT